MSQSISAGGLAVLDPADSRVLQFNFDDELPASVEISSYVWTITALKQSGATALTKDNESLVTGNRKVQVRLIASTATAGDRYEVACKITTNETPANIIEQSFEVLIQDR